MHSAVRQLLEQVQDNIVELGNHGSVAKITVSDSSLQRQYLLHACDALKQAKLLASDNTTLSYAALNTPRKRIDLSPDASLVPSKKYPGYITLTVFFENFRPAEVDAAIEHLLNDQHKRASQAVSSPELEEQFRSLAKAAGIDIGSVRVTSDAVLFSKPDGSKEDDWNTLVATLHAAQFFNPRDMRTIPLIDGAQDNVLFLPLPREAERIQQLKHSVFEATTGAMRAAQKRVPLDDASWKSRSSILIDSNGATKH